MFEYVIEFAVLKYGQIQSLQKSVSRVSQSEPVSYTTFNYYFGTPAYKGPINCKFM